MRVIARGTAAQIQETAADNHIAFSDIGGSDGVGDDQGGVRNENSGGHGSPRWIRDDQRSVRDQDKSGDNIGGPRLLGQRSHIIALVRNRIKAGIDRIRIVIVVDKAGKLVVSRVQKGRIHRAVRVQPRRAHAPREIERGEVAADENLPVRLELHVINRVRVAGNGIISAGSRRESSVHGAVRIQPCDAVVIDQFQP